MDFFVFMKEHQIIYTGFWLTILCCVKGWKLLCWDFCVFNWLVGLQAGVAADPVQVVLRPGEAGGVAHLTPGAGSEAHHTNLEEDVE